MTGGADVASTGSGAGASTEAEAGPDGENDAEADRAVGEPDADGEPDAETEAVGETHRTSTERMGPADSILWRIQHDPVLRSTVTVVAVLDRAPDPDLRRRLLEAAAHVARLRQVVAEPLLAVGSPRWVVSADFDVDYHLRRVRLPAPTSLQDVFDFAARETMSGFDRTRPLWELTVVDEVDGGAAVVLRFHHAVTDGIGGLRLALQVLDGGCGTAPRGGGKPVLPERPRSGEHPAANGARRRLGHALGHAGVAVRRGARLPGRTIHLTGDALRAARHPLGTANAVAGALRGGAHLVAPTSAPLSPLLRGRSTGLRFAAFDVDLGRLHAAAGALGGTLNDVFVAAVAGGLRHYHEDLGRPVGRLRITLPVSIRRPGDPSIANRFAPVRFTVPLVADPAALVRAVARLVRPWSDGPGLGLADALSVALNALPTPVLSSVFGSLLRSVDFVATNVPGLAGPVYLAGAEVQRLYAFAPPSGAAVNVALVTHAGIGCIGVDMDPAAVGDPSLLVRTLRQGFDEVLRLASPAPRRAPG